MSEDEKPLEFSARDLMPDWAQEKPRSTPQDFATRFAKDEDRRDRRRDGDRRDGRRGGDFRGRNDRQDRRDRHPRQERGGPRGEHPRGDRSRGDGRGDRREGADRGPRDRDRRPPHAVDRPAENVVASVEPSGPAIEGLVRHIRETFRAFPLADLAQMILGARERYRIRFTATEPSRLHQCLADGSLWLSREEAISHLLSGPALSHYYLTEEVDVEPPSGQFAVIAVCGLSGVILGPPNHHEYQRNIARLHRERFSDMSLERYKSRIRMESGEEILEKWRQQVSRVRQYRVKASEVTPLSPAPADLEAAPAPEGETAAAPDEATVEAAVATTESTETEGLESASVEDGSADAPADAENAPAEGSAEEAIAPEAEAPEDAPEENASEAAEPPASEAAPEADAPAEVILKSLDEVSRHFREHFADAAIVETSVAVVPGNIPGRLLSPGLLLHLKQETEKLRRGFPLPLIQALCQEFERHGLRFFKRGKKALHVSAIRPKAIDEDVTLTEAIRNIVDFVKDQPKPTVAGLLTALVPGFQLPEGPTLEESADWSDAAKAVLKDLRWLTSEGYILEFPDTSLALGRPPQAKSEGSQAEESAPAKPKAAKAEKKAKARQNAEAPAEAPAATPSAPPAPSAGESPVEDAPSDQLPEGEDEGLDGGSPHDPYELPDSVDPVETF